MNLIKLESVFNFFKSTVAVNFAVSILPFFFGGVIAFSYSFISFGFLISLLLKEINAKNEYLFYYNNQISKIQLWLFSWLFTFVLLVISRLIFNVLQQLV
ncbi:hypothetical protein ACRASX_04005 [Flavobacterium sp. TMP13]|uniref:hypothetical protein n=1 Tax=unclassified Flavobacterium TaxID=196869 RepID=UPI00076D91BA|nr:hypothetical protein [Flavobacterium sp. TAB 87]KVV13259.1 hypothetical protein AP058_02622 [Flavobacterium sp. TAB 87]